MVEPNLAKANNTYVSFQTFMFFTNLIINNQNQVVLTDYDKDSFDDDLLVGNGTPLLSQYSNSNYMDSINNIPLGLIDNILSSTNNYGATIHNNMYYYTLSHTNLVDTFANLIQGKSDGTTISDDDNYHTTQFLTNVTNTYICSDKPILVLGYLPSGNFSQIIEGTPSKDNSYYFYQVTYDFPYYKLSFETGTKIYEVSQDEFNNKELYFESDLELGDYYMGVKQNTLYEVDLVAFFPSTYTVQLNNTQQSHVIDLQLIVDELDTGNQQTYITTLDTSIKGNQQSNFIFNSNENKRVKLTIKPVQTFPCYLTNVVVRAGIDRITKQFTPIFVCSDLAKLYQQEIMLNQTLTFRDLDHDSLIYKIMKTPMASQTHGLFRLFQLCMLELSAIQYAQDNDENLFAKFSMKDLKRLMHNLKCIAYYFGVFPKYIEYIEDIRSLITATGYFKNKYSFDDTNIDYREGYYNDI